MEFCRYGKQVEIGDNCLVSGIDLSKVNDSEKIKIPNNSVVITWPLTLPDSEVSHPYVTIILPIDADIKEDSKVITWFNLNEQSSFYTAEIFPITDDPGKSLKLSLECLQSGIREKSGELKKYQFISLQKAVQSADYIKALRIRHDIRVISDHSY